MVVGTTVEEAILDEIVSTLSTIQGAPSYSTTVQQVSRVYVDALELRALPAIVVYHKGTEQREDRLGLVRSEMEVSLVLAMSPTGPDWHAAVIAFIADVQAKLREDHTRGGNAMVTFIEGSMVWPANPDTPVVGGQVDIRVHFRYDYNDPTRPL